MQQTQQPQKRWDPRADQIRMLRSLGLSWAAVAASLRLSTTRLDQIRLKYESLGPPTIEERLERLQTPGEKRLGANLIALSCRLQSLPVPKILREWESPSLSGIGPSRAVLELMRKDQALPEHTDFYVTKILAPELIDAKLPNPW